MARWRRRSSKHRSPLALTFHKSLQVFSDRFKCFLSLDGDGTVTQAPDIYLQYFTRLSSHLFLSLSQHWLSIHIHLWLLQLLDYSPVVLSCLQNIVHHSFRPLLRKLRIVKICPSNGCSDCVLLKCWLNALLSSLSYCSNLSPNRAQLRQRRRHICNTVRSLITQLPSSCLARQWLAVLIEGE